MKLNFKDIAGEFLADKATDLIEDTIEDLLDTDQSATITTNIDETPFTIDDPSLDHASITPSHTSNAVIETKQVARDQLHRINAKNIFSLPSVLVALFFLFSLVYADLSTALDDDTFTSKELLKIAYILAGGIIQISSRGTEGKTGCYTPKILPGLKREDFIDENHDGIDDRHQ